MRLYFIKCKPAGGLTHAGTGKTLMTTFDNRQLLESTYDNNIQEMLWKEKMTTLGTGNAFMVSAITLVI